MAVYFLITACLFCSLCIWPASPDSAHLLPVILSLVSPPIHPAWLMANQHFIKPIRGANLYHVQENCFTAASDPKLEITQVSVNKQLNKLWCVHANKELLSSTSVHCINSNKKLDKSKNNGIEWKKPDNIEFLLYDSSSGKCQLLYINKKQNVAWCGTGKGEEKEKFTNEHEKLRKGMGFLIILPVSEIHIQGRLHPLNFVWIYCVSIVRQ